MQDAKYFRTQAELCLQLARVVSNHSAAQNLRARAAQHHARAIELESPTRAVQTTPAGAAAPTSRAMRRFYFPVEYNGAAFGDDRGELFSTESEAETYANVVARELGRNNKKPVTVFLVDESGNILAKATPDDGQK